MGATRTKSQRVNLEYRLTDSEGNEFTLGVTAQVDFGSGVEYDARGFVTGSATDDDVTALTCAWNDEKGVAGELVKFYDLPKAMQSAIKLKAIEIAGELAFS